MRQLKQERLLYLGGSRSCFKIMPILGVPKIDMPSMVIFQRSSCSCRVSNKSFGKSANKMRVGYARVSTTGN